MAVWLTIRSANDFDKLYETGLSPLDFALAEVTQWCRLYLSGAVKGTLVEYPYVDKDYRSTYYNYYAKKGIAYDSYCARLHLFRGGVTFEAPASSLRINGRPRDATDDELTRKYLGFVTLRPTKRHTIGRTVINPAGVRGAKGQIIVSRHKAHVLGHRLQVRGFPFMQQHSDIAVCAHTVCWAILRHYSERYSSYGEILLHRIARLGREFEPGGLLPSLGISARDAERVFAAAGTYPLLVYDGEPSSGSEPEAQTASISARFSDELLAYLESGFPLFGIFADRPHVASIVGYRSQTTPMVDSCPHVRAADFLSHLIVSNDNTQPYEALSRKKAPKVGGVSGISAFIVPLPEKMFLPAAKAIKHATDLLRHPPDEFEDLAELKDLVSRCFVTTTAAWQRFVRVQAASLPVEFVCSALQLATPQFLWICEFARPEQRAQQTIHARLLLDATAGAEDAFPAFLIHDRKGALWIDRAQRAPMRYEKFPTAVESFQEVSDNLATY